MDIQWTRMAGQTPLEASPLVGKFTSSGKDEILALNQGGQLLLWTSDGKAIGSGQDGLVAQMPEGKWTTAPTLLRNTSDNRFVLTSVKGLVVCLDRDFHPLWQYQLPGETPWGRAMPAVLKTATGPLMVFSDSSGTSTCLSLDGKAAWTNALAAGPCKAPPQIISLKPGEDSVLLPAGSNLFCCDTTGKVRWQVALDKDIVTRPEILSLPDRQLILCGTASGSLFALDLNGKIIWECATGETFSNAIATVPRRNAELLIVFSGLWGNLHAVDIHGRHLWTHLFRAKTRATPLVLDVDGDTRTEIVVPTFHQHVLIFNEAGELKDDIRLSGVMPSALVPITDSNSTHPDLLVTTTTLLSYRLRSDTPKSPYGTSPAPLDVTIHPPSTDDLHEHPAVLIKNPNGALINVHLSLTDTKGWTRLIAELTSQSAFEIPLPAFASSGAWSFRANAMDANGKLLADKSWRTPTNKQSQAASSPAFALRAWPTPPFASFADTRLSPFADEINPTATNTISIENIYLAEADQGAFIVASTRDEPTRARVTLTRLARNDGTAFGGQVVVREVLSTGSVNGERVPDALPALGEANLITIPANRSVKIWMSVDTHGALPGSYTGQVSVVSLNGDAKNIGLPLNLEVLNLRLPKEFPLTLCTWDYVPNRWFPTRSKEVLDDMSKHGVNVFPRTIIPPGRVDAAGKLTIDWPVLDAELDRLNHRGKILFHLNHPPIEFAVKKTDEEKRPSELEYIRKLRDHLRERGRGYEDYAFYLLDEPGLDNGPNIAILVDAGKLFREADPRLLTYTDPVAGLSWKDYERIEPLVDIWTPNMRLVSGLLSGDPRIARIMKQKTVWSYECISQVKSLSPLRYNRANAWRAKFFGLGGIGFWTHSTTEVDHWYAGKGINDEYALVYPGELPVPSVRWEAVRDGLEDIAAMSVLEAQIKRHRQAGTKSELVKKAEETLGLALRDVMELSDDAFTESRDFLRAGDRVLAHTWTDMELFATHRAEIAKLTLALSAE